MGTKRFTITESEIDSIKKLYMIEQSEEKEDRKFCHGGNVKSLEEIVGSDDIEDYIDGVQIRQKGVNGLVDKMEEIVVNLGEIFLEMKILKFWPAKIGEISYFRGKWYGVFSFQPYTEGS